MRRATLAEPPVFRLTGRERGHVVLTADTNAVAHLFVLEDDIVRLLLLADGKVTSPPSWAIAPGLEDIAEPGRDRLSLEHFSCPDFELEEHGGELTLMTARIRLTIALNGLHCHWQQRVAGDWRTMQQDRQTQAYNFGWWDDRTHHHVARTPGERFYGLGEKTGPLDRAGRRFRMSALDPMGYDPQSTDPLYKSIPWLLVAQADGVCHGCFYDSVAEASVDLGAEMDNYHGAYRHFVADTGDLDMWMIAGSEPAAVVERFTWLTGRPAATPDWALSYSGSTMTYTDAPDAQARMNEFLARIAEFGIPCQSFHLSSGYSSIGDKRYVFTWNREKFPDPQQFAADFRAAGVRLVANIKPALLRDHPLYLEAASAGLFVSNADGAPTLCQFWDEVGSYIDFTNPAAAAWWRDKVTAQLLNHGIAATWNDNNEYEIWDSRAQFHGFGSHIRAVDARPTQPILMARASRRAQIEHAPGETPYVVTRSGGAGLHRYAQTWTGDNRTGWDSLKWNMRTALGLSLSGVSNVGHDIGGFAGPSPDPELFLRWIEHGVALPRFSIHSWNDDGSVNEPWMYPEIISQVRRLMVLREALVPLFAHLLADYRTSYKPILRPLWLNFPKQPDLWRDGDEFMLGSDILVAAVTVPGSTRVRAQLPAEFDWIDLRDGRRVDGGSSIELAAPLGGAPIWLCRDSSELLPALCQCFTRF